METSLSAVILLNSMHVKISNNKSTQTQYMNKSGSIYLKKSSPLQVELQPPVLYSSWVTNYMLQTLGYLKSKSISKPAFNFYYYYLYTIKLDGVNNVDVEV